MKNILVTGLLLAVPTLAAADTGEPLSLRQRAPEHENSINISPLGALVGNYALTYEHLWNGTHGLIVEGNGSRQSNDDGSSYQLGGGVGYRWHWRGKQNSGFLGMMVAQGFGNGKVVETVNGQTMSYEMGIRSTTVTGNVGKRWMIGDAFNITLRLGLGWGHYTATAKVDDQAAKDAEKTMNDLLAFLPIGFDGEVSVGYAF